MPKWKIIFLAAVCLANCVSCASHKNSLVLEGPPPWYNERLKQEFVDVAELMDRGFSRLEALEIQNNALKRSKNENSSFDEVLAIELDNFKKDQVGESGFKPLSDLKTSDFIIIFDMDETLLVQWYKSYSKGEKYSDLCSGLTDKNFLGTLQSTDCVKFTPALEATFRKIKKLKGFKGLVLFTAKGHEAAHAIFDKWTIEGKPLRSQVSGVFTRNYLTRGGKVYKPSKDVRMIDPSLEHAIIVDDNPSRLFQPKNVRIFPKFNGDNFLKAKHESKDRKTIKYYESLLRIILEEIQDSYEYASKQDIPFVKAFHPYSQHGAYCMRMIQDALGYSKKRAANFHRKNPELCKDVFYGTKIKK